MKENFDNLGPIIYFFNGQDAGNNLYIFLTDMKTSRLFHFVSSTNIGQILKLLNKVDFFSVTIFQQYYLSLQYLLQYQSFKESCVQGLTGQKKCPFEAKVSFFF